MCRRRVAPLMVQFPPFGGDVTGKQVTHRSSCSATPPLTVSEVTPRGSAAHSANHLDNKRRQRGVVGEMACVVDATAPDLVCRSHMNR